ncbi:MAG: hypothetical protein ACFCA4_12475 [Cyanophyceae cyanobacterium]
MPNYDAGKNGVQTRFKPQGEITEPLAKKPINTTHYVRVDGVLRSLPNRQEKIREYVLEGLRRDGLLD